MVGTPAAIVGRQLAMAADNGAACRNCWGITRSAPTRKAAYGVPQALTWNIGTTVNTLSYALTEMAAADVRASEWRKLERWL